MCLSIFSVILLLFATVNADVNTTEYIIKIHNNCEATLNIKIFDMNTMPYINLESDGKYVKLFNTIKIDKGVSEINVSSDFDSFMYASVDVYDKTGELLPLLSISDISNIVLDESLRTIKFYPYTDYDELWLCVPNTDIEVKPIDMTRIIEIQNDCDHDVFIGQAVYSYNINSPVEMVCKPRKRLVQGGVIELYIYDAPFISFFSAYDPYKNTNVDVTFDKFVSMGMVINRIIETSKPLIDCNDYISRNEVFYFYNKHVVLQRAILCFKSQTNT
ncbi:hypothetical protein PBCV1_A138R [Paramecium bursaria Chlorella virus 1]|uniref:Uncharacterized protein n=1 Tax=Paramecium bursaria Chlorella virus 1 TaxID=10506 RepID=Q84458_PBCV1|nr:hypothetical protein PBCV1_A138R [Paramecium bursaria Chlorella virus 1]AAC96506.1 hypothetical protein [Paramecium bursaria Chlorella virus 1]